MEKKSQESIEGDNYLPHKYREWKEEGKPVNKRDKKDEEEEIQLPDDLEKMLKDIEDDDVNEIAGRLRERDWESLAPRPKSHIVHIHSELQVIRMYTYVTFAICTYVHICTHMYTYVHICTHTYTYVYICTHIYTYVHKCTHMYTYVHICGHITYVHICTHMWTYYICTHM